MLLSNCNISHRPSHGWDQMDAYQQAHPDNDSSYTPPKNYGSCGLMDFCE